MTITEFLLARIAEDETSNDTLVCEEVERCRADGMGDLTEDEVRASWGEQSWWRRRLAECEAKRRIVERCAERANPYADWPDSARWLAEDILSDLASVYSDHPDFRKEMLP